MVSLRTTTVLKKYYIIDALNKPVKAQQNQDWSPAFVEPYGQFPRLPCVASFEPTRTSMLVVAAIWPMGGDWIGSGWSDSLLSVFKDCLAELVARQPLRRNLLEGGDPPLL